MKTMKRFSIIFLMAAFFGFPVPGTPVDPPRMDEKARFSQKDIPTVAFCDLVKRPTEFFDRPIRVSGMFTQADEAQYLSDRGCPLKTEDQIGVGFADADDAGRERRAKDISKIGKPEFGGRAMVRVVGYLRNQSRHDFACYRYRFDIVRFEDMSPVVLPFEGELQAGMTYRASVQGDEMAGLALVRPLKVAEHHAIRLEWVNLNAFSNLGRMRGMGVERVVVFSVLSDEVKQITHRRWNRTVRLKILREE